MIADNDYNIIKPVENPHNVGAMTPIDRRAENRRRQGQQKQRRAAANQQDISDDRQDEAGSSGSDQTGCDSIDYRA
jgi:hypothetical protein